jgi:hypothetical protein
MDYQKLIPHEKEGKVSQKGISKKKHNHSNNPLSKDRMMMFTWHRVT